MANPHSPKRCRMRERNSPRARHCSRSQIAMAFASIFIPNFMMQAVVRCEPSLGGSAVAIIDGTAPVWSVAALNEAAAKAGISIGMTKSQVQQFLGIEIRHRSPAREKAAHAALLDLGWSFSPRVEDTAPDTKVLDLAGLNSLFGSDKDIAAQLSARASNFGLSTQIAVAAKIEAAIIAARGFGGITIIPEGREAEILGSLPANALSPSLEALETLERWGVRTCAALAGLPVVQLSERLGQEGVRLHELARGRSERWLTLAEPALHFEEEMELEDAVEELEPLSFLLGRLLGQLCARLAARSLAVCAVRVRFELDSSFEPNATQPGYKSGLQSSRRKIGGQGSRYERVLSLPVPMRDPKILLNLLRLHLQADPLSAPILKIMVAAEAARPRVTQGGLFLPSFPDPEKLELTIVRLASVVGDANVGSPELSDTHRPGELRMRRFVTETWVEKQRRKRASSRQSGHEEGSFDCAASNNPAASLKTTSSNFPRTGLRVFRPAMQARVELCEGCPTRVAFRGMSGRVVAASGPWRSSGDWWREDGWQNDEWDLEIVFTDARSGLEKPSDKMRESSALKALQVITAAAPQRERQRGLYRIVFDWIRKEWFVRGAYD